MTDPKPTNNRAFESEVAALNGLLLVKDTPKQPVKVSETLPESSIGAPRDMVERLLNRIKKL
jgi:hypothetical protein